MPIWGRIAVGLLGLAIGLAVVARITRAVWSASERRSLNSMVSSARASESSGRVADAIVELEGALAYAEQMSSPPSQLESIRRWRAGLSLRDARARLAAIDRQGGGVEPALAVGEARTLLARAEKDDALTPLVPEIHRSLSRHLERWAIRDGAEARQAIQQGDGNRAMELCLRMRKTGRELDKLPRERIESHAETLAREVILHRGVTIDPVRGKFSLGSPESYDKPLLGPLTDALRQRGFVPRPATSPWDHLWETLPPFRMTFEVVETQPENYLESPNRLSRIEGLLQLRRGEELLWSDRQQSRTQVPLPRTPAYLASRLAVSAKRSPEFERFLYENARESLDARLGHACRNIPSCPVPEPAPSTSSGSA